jgi:hypothetical protein
MTGPTPDQLAEHRHAEIVEQLRRVNTSLEALHRLGERQLSELRDVTARMRARCSSWCGIPAVVWSRAAWVFLSSAALALLIGPA